MRELFNVTELVKIGIQDETSGVVFYSAAAQRTQNDKLKNIFLDLAQQEKYHKKRFEDMFAAMGGTTQKEEYPGQYVAYLEALTSSRAFPNENVAADLAAKCKTDLEIIELAVRFERDTIILMNEMKNVLPDDNRGIVAELVREEQSHLAALDQARRTI